MPLDSLAAALSHDHFTVRAKVFKLFGAAFHVYDPAGNVVLYCKMKAFKLKEDLRLYAGEAMETPLMAIKARQIIDFSASYDVIDLTAGSSKGVPAGGTLEYASNSEGGLKVGALRRKGLKSMIRDSWEILGTDDGVIGTVREDGGVKAVLRRLHPIVSMAMPQSYFGEATGGRVFEMRQNFNPFVRKLACDFSADPQHRLDRRLGLAAAVLLMAIEGRQG